MTTPNIDTKALRELRDDACNLDGRSLMEVLHAQQKYERAIIAAAPALLELQSVKAERDTLDRTVTELSDGMAKVADERDALKAEVAWRQGAHDTLFKTASEIQAERNDLRSKLSASEREVERLRSDAEKGDYIPTSMYLQRCEELRTAQREAESVSHWIRLNDMATAKLSASEREAERLREALTTIDEAFAEGGFFDEGFARSTIRAALRGEEAPRE